MRAWRGRIFLIILIPFLLAPKESVALNCLSERVMNAVSAHAEDKKEIERILKELENVEVSMVAEQIDQLEREIKVKIEEQPGNFVLHYLLARTYYAWGQYYLEVTKDKDKKQGKVSLEQALISAEEAIRQKKDFSDAYRVAGDLYGWLIDLKGSVLYGPLYGTKAEKLLKKAQQYDSGNPEVYLALGRNYLYKPIIVGGNRKKALESFKMAVRLCPDYYFAHMWLGQGYVDRGLLEEAKESFKEALKHEPNGSWAKEEIKRLGGR